MKTTLVTTDELAQHPEWRVFDCRHELANPDKGAALYAESHIPGARHAHLDRDLSGTTTGSNGRHPLPAVEQFAAWLSRQGLQPTDQVVVYDEGAGAFASRLWWMLRWVGHPAVAVLDGGFAKWTSEGKPVTTEVPSFPPSNYTVALNDALRVDVAAVEQNLRDQKFHMLDARAATRYAGQEETLDPVGGHIPGALNRAYALNLNEAGTFKSAEELRQEFDALLGSIPAAEVVCQCGSGVTACHDLLAMEVAGLTGARLYPGSWSEWCADPKRPVATGNQP
ncbi:MAG: sulfurtransferase [Acidobacteriaceae bacterium]